MQYRKFGKLGFEVSALGMGCMRLPLLEPEPGADPAKINEAEAIGLNSVRFS